MKPFLKWAGSKRAVIPDLEPLFPSPLSAATIRNYYEPFVGSGSVLFHILNRYKVNPSYISDTNPALICTFLAVRDDLPAVMLKLRSKQQKARDFSHGMNASSYQQTRSIISLTSV